MKVYESVNSGTGKELGWLKEIEAIKQKVDFSGRMITTYSKLLRTFSRSENKIKPGTVI